MTDQIQATPALPTPVEPSQDMPPLGGRVGQAVAAESVKKRTRIRKPKMPEIPAQDPAPVVVPRCTPEKARELCNILFGMVDPVANGLAEKLDPAAQKVTPGYTFKIAGEERERLTAIGVECIQTLPANVTPPWLPWVVLAVVAGGSAWSRYAMIRQIRAAQALAPDAPKPERKT
jgi:hypothetical protein